MKKRLLTILLAAAVLCAAPAVFAAENEAVYSDVPVDAEIAVDVRYLKEQNLMEGVGGGLFAPEILTSNAMLAAALWRMEGSPAPSGTPSGGQWYAAPVLWAAERDVMGGDVAPEGALTTEELMVVLYDYASDMGFWLCDGTALPEGTEPADKASLPALEWAWAAGLLEEGAELPQPINRGEAAVVLAKFHRDIFGTTVITILPAENGAISPERGVLSSTGTVGVKRGESITFTVTPNRGYRIGQVLVDGEKTNGHHVYTFENVTGPHTITAVFVPRPVPSRGDPTPEPSVEPSVAPSVEPSVEPTPAVSPEYPLPTPEVANLPPEA